MVMEFCGGGTLSIYYMQPHFDDSEFVRIMNELFGAITYLHQREIAHRDLKPENVNDYYLFFCFFSISNSFP